MSAAGSDPAALLLATTALEETWGDDEEVVFLGEWCRSYDRKEAWAAVRHTVVRSHWGDRAKLRADQCYLERLHDALLEELTAALNRYHGLQRPLRYWQMLIDPWLLTYVAVLWDRWESLRVAFEEHGVLTTIPSARVEPRATLDYSDFMERILGDPWNHELFLEIIEIYYADRCTIRSSMEARSAPEGAGAIPPPPSRSVRYKVVGGVDNLIGHLPLSNDVLFFETYWPPAALLRLNLMLGQLPRLYLREFDWHAALQPGFARDSQSPSDRGIALSFSAATEFEGFLLKRLVKDMPLAYVERFSSLLEKVRRIALEPKVILTANAHWANELFKLWSAERVLDGSKLVIMEHGGSIPPAFSGMSFEERVADRRTTWARPYHPKHTRLPPSKLASAQVTSTKEYLAVLGLELPRYNFKAEAAPKAGDVIACCDMVSDFYAGLNPRVQDRFLIRPGLNRGWNIRRRFVDALGKDRVSTEPSYRRFLSGARVIVSTYPQTTFSEAMASGLPAILLYDARLWETIPQMDPLLEMLRAAKILFHDPLRAAAHVSGIWNDADGWWQSAEVLEVRREFHMQATAMDDDMLTQWSTFIRSMSKLKQ